MKGAGGKSLNGSSVELYTAVIIATIVETVANMAIKHLERFGSAMYMHMTINPGPNMLE